MQIRGEKGICDFAVMHAVGTDSKLAKFLPFGIGHLLFLPSLPHHLPFPCARVTRIWTCETTEACELWYEYWKGASKLLELAEAFHQTTFEPRESTWSIWGLNVLDITKRLHKNCTPDQIEKLQTSQQLNFFATDYYILAPIWPADQSREGARSRRVDCDN